MAELTDAIEAARHAVGLNLHDAARAITAAAPLIEASVRAKIAEEIARAIEGYSGGEYGCCECPKDRDLHAGIARNRAVRMPVEAAERPNTPDAYPSEGATASDAQKPCGCVGKCPSLFVPCPVCGSEVRAVGVDNTLATTYHPCKHVVPDEETP